MSNYATNADLKNPTGVVTSDFARKTDLVNLWSHVDKSDIDRLKNIPTYLSNLKSKVDELVPVAVALRKPSDVLKKMLSKNIENNIPDITDLATTTALNAKIMSLKTKYLTLLS